MKSRFSKSQAGFTLIELLVTATIISMLTVIGLVSYRQASIASRDAKRRADIETIRQALVLYKTENTAYPTPTGTAYAAFTSMKTTLATAKYLSGANDIVDPKDGQATGVTIYTQYGYFYTATASTFSVCEFPENNPTNQPICATNP